METQTTAPKRQKADIDLKIELPNSEKPFFNKTSTENNMISQLKKAGTKLADNEKLTVSVNDKTISLSKVETESPTLKDTVQSKISDHREINKGSQEKEDQKQPETARPMDNTPAQTTPQKNVDFLKDQVKYLGFGEDKELQDKIEKSVNSDKTEFKIATTSDKTSFQNKVNFELQFHRSAETNTVFFNKFDARLTNEKRGLDIQHTFAVKNNGFTAKQAINLLEGRAVKTEITNPNTKEKETAFVKLKLNEEKNENGNFKLQVYNKNYGVDTAKIVEKSNLVFKDANHKDITIKSLEKGNIVGVKFKNDDKVQEGKAVLNPQYKTLNLYDTNMKRVNTNAPVLEEAAETKQQVKAQQHQSRKL